jgi:cytochrome c
VTGLIFLAASGAMADVDIANGKKIAKKCMVCHTLTQGGKTRLGPNLYGILGKPAGKVSDFKYSKAMASSGLVWDRATFSDFIANPKKVIQGTKMSFRGIKKAAQRADLLAYFETLGSGGKEAVIAGNAKTGKVAAAKYCTVCHSFEKGGRVVYGPNLFGIAGKPAAGVKGYNYSDAMKKSGIVWTDRNLIAFMADPQKFLMGTKARFPGLKKAQDKSDILAYLKSFK